MTRNSAAAGVAALLTALFASGEQIWASVLLALVCGWFARSAAAAFEALPDTQAAQAAAPDESATPRRRKPPTWSGD